MFEIGVVGCLPRIRVLFLGPREQLRDQHPGRRSGQLLIERHGQAASGEAQTDSPHEQKGRGRGVRAESTMSTTIEVGVFGGHVCFLVRCDGRTEP